MGGNVGIGTATPNSPLHILRSGAGNVQTLANGSVSYTWGLDASLNLALATNYLVVSSGGNIGIGDTGPDARLEVLATTEQLRLTNVDDTTDARFTVSATGDLTIDMLGSGTTD